MNGVIAVRSLLVADTGVTALVPAARIVAGVIPQGTGLPAISLMSVSSTDRNIPAPGPKRRVIERVQVTVLASSYPAAKAIMRAVRAAAADRMPAIEGLTDVTVHTDSAGPDFLHEETSIHMQTQDFRVSFNDAPLHDADGNRLSITVYGPGTRIYQRAQARQQNLLVDKIKKRGKMDQTAEEKLAEQAEFLAACTVSFNHFTYPPAEGLEGAALFRKAYEDPSIGFIAAQVAAHINDWANFTTSSAAS